MPERIPARMISFHSRLDLRICTQLKTLNRETVPSGKFSSFQTADCLDKSLGLAGSILRKVPIVVAGKGENRTY